MAISGIALLSSKFVVNLVMASRPAVAALVVGTALLVVYSLRKRKRSGPLRGADGGKPLCLFFGPSARFASHPVLAPLAETWNMESWTPGDTQDYPKNRLAKVDVLVGGLQPVLELLPSMPRLRLLQCPFTGTDWLDPERIPQNVDVCNAFGMDLAIAEYVMAALLHMELRLDLVNEEFHRSRTFRPPWAPPPAGQEPFQFRNELKGKTVALIGFGHIGQEIAARASAFGMIVEAIVKRPRKSPPPSPLAYWGAGDVALGEVLGRADYVVLCCPLDDSSHHLLNDARLKQLKPSAILVNVGRGPLVDEEALYNSLSEKSLRGAVLDVWFKYPDLKSPVEGELYVTLHSTTS